MSKHEKKYTVHYCSGATGYGWTTEFDCLNEFEGFVDEMRTCYTAFCSVWDDGIKDFIFYKRVLEYKPEIDMLRGSDRDMRTTTRKRKV